jgi:hypothetical protein
MVIPCFSIAFTGAGRSSAWLKKGKKLRKTDALTWLFLVKSMCKVKDAAYHSYR